MPNDLLNSVLSLDFLAFVEKCFDQLHGPGRFVPGAHINVVTHHVERAIAGEHKRLLINMPPRHLKSFIVSVCLPAFLLGKSPGKKIILATYGEKLSVEHASKTRAIMSSGWYREVFPKTNVAPNTSNTMLRTTQNGYLFATSVDGPGTGFGADVILVDDLAKADASPAERDKANKWFEVTLATRFDDPKQGVTIVAMHRTHTDDLSGYLLAQTNWTHLKLSAIATASQSLAMGTGSKFTRNIGDALHPERMTGADIEVQRATLIPSVFAAQYQQEPDAESEALFDRKWFHDIPEVMNLNNYDYIVHSWDAASGEAATASFSVCTVWGILGDRCDLIHVYRKRVNYTRLRVAALKLVRRYPPTHIVIENASSGRALLSDLMNLFDGRIIAAVPTRGKTERAEEILDLLYAHGINYPKHAPWANDFLQEVLAFPAGFHDDQVDSLTQFLAHKRYGFDRLFRIPASVLQDWIEDNGGYIGHP
ncbi:phage terminase large subunit [Pyruvatibacter sp.]